MTNFLKTLSIFALVSSFPSCSSAPESKSKVNAQANESGREERVSRVGIQKVETSKEFRLMIPRESMDVSAAVKFVYFFNPRTNPSAPDQLHFVDGRDFLYHASYIDEVLGAPSVDHERDVDFIQGAINYLPALEGQSERIGIYIESTPSNDVAKRFMDKIYKGLPWLKAEQVYLLSSKDSEDVPSYADSYKRYRELGYQVMDDIEFLGLVQTHMTYNDGESYGYLRYVTIEQVEAGEYTDRDILILDRIPLDIGPVAGVISLSPQTPNSHVILRTINQKVPNVFNAEWLLDKEPLAGKIGQLVKLSAEKDDPETDEADDYAFVDSAEDLRLDQNEMEEEAKKYWDSRKKIIPTPVADLSEKSIWVWNKQGLKDDLGTKYGAKGTNFAFIDVALQDKNIDRQRFQNSFLVPYSAYDSHMKGQIKVKACEKAAKKCAGDLGATCTTAKELCLGLADRGNLWDYTELMLNTNNRQKMNDSAPYRRQFLFFMQRLVRAVDVPADVYAMIKVGMEAYPATTRMRLRSSTNAEDLSGLNGAGLYESKAACVADGEDSEDDDGKASACRSPAEIDRLNAQIAKLKSLPEQSAELKKAIEELEENLTQKNNLSDSIRAVYASTWTERAFLTREFYGLVHSKVYMGILVHPSFDEESANGVATMIMNDQGGATLHIVGQVDDISVTNPIFPGAIAEEWQVVVDRRNAVTSSRLTKESNQRSTRVINDMQRTELVKELLVARDALKKRNPSESNFDFEFMFDAQGEVLIKQGRPL